MAKRNLFYAQSGGVTAVLNATACAVIETARKYRSEIGKVCVTRRAALSARRGTSLGAWKKARPSTSG